LVLGPSWGLSGALLQMGPAQKPGSPSVSLKQIGLQAITFRLGSAVAIAIPLRGASCQRLPRHRVFGRRGRMIPPSGDYSTPWGAITFLPRPLRHRLRVDGDSGFPACFNATSGASRQGFPRHRDFGGKGIISGQRVERGQFGPERRSFGAPRNRLIPKEFRHPLPS